MCATFIDYLLILILKNPYSRQYSDLEEAIRSRKHKLKNLDKELHKVESLLDDGRSERSNLDSELAGLRSSISGK